MQLFKLTKTFIVWFVFFMTLCAYAPQSLASTIGETQPAGPSDGPRPNILFIAIDDLKPLLGCYGDDQIVSPSIDRLAKESVVFTNAHCQYPVCGGSRASLMTGLRPEASGVMDLKTSMRHKNPDVISLPQLFRQSGYATAAAGKIYDPRCVDDKKTYDAPSWSVPYARIKHSELKTKDGIDRQVAVVSEFGDEDLSDGWIRKKGVQLLRELDAGDEPFFLAVGFKKPHLPFIAPKQYWDLYSADKIQLAKHSGGIKNDSGYSIHDSPEFRGYDGVPEEGPFSEELQRHCLHGYRACVSFVDAQVGMLLKELESLGLKDNTIVVLWGDHGFHLGDHGMFGKHTTLEQATRVPMMIHVPGALAGKTNTPVELCDLFPTLSELAGIKTPPVDGRSLKSVLSEPSSKVRDGALTVFKHRGAFGYSFRSERYRYTEWVNKNSKTVAKELFDYSTDPMETVNLADQPEMSEVQSTLARQLRTHAQGCERLKTVVDDTTTSATTLPQQESFVSTTQKLAVPKYERQSVAIRDLSNHKGDYPLLLGAASNAKLWDTPTYKILNREFSYVTPANDFKQSAIHPMPDKWKWEIADEWVERCEKHGQVMRLHSAVSPQCSKWAKADDRTAEELEQNMAEYLTAVCKRYNGKPHVRWMDVVNETVSRDGTWFGPRKGSDRWENPWYQIGVDENHPLKPPVYIKRAFEIANEHAPDIKQIVNQHGDMEPEMWGKVKGLIEYLQEEGLRVDGVGWQAHINAGFEKDEDQMNRLRSLIEWAQARGMEFHVTEFTCWIRKENEGEAVTEEDLRDQAKTYRAILTLLNDYADKGVVTWCTWQIKDTDTERHFLRGNMFDADAKPKRAYYAIRSGLKKFTGK